MCVGVICTSGFVAAVLFPTMKRLNPRLPEFEAFGGEHWRIAAGQVGAKMFAAAGWAQSALMIIGLLALASATSFSLRSVAARVRLGVVLTAAAAAMISNSMIYQPMVRIIGEFWRAAAGGQIDIAAAKEAEFTAMHGWSTGSMLAMIVLNLACLVVAAKSLCSTPAPVPVS